MSEQISFKIAVLTGRARNSNAPSYCIAAWCSIVDRRTERLDGRPPRPTVPLCDSSILLFCVTVTVTVTEIHSSTKKICSQEESCSVSLSKQVGLQLWSELLHGDCCVVSECQVEVRSRPSEPQWRNFAGRWTCLPAKRTGHHGQRTKWPTWQIRD